jgi:hypothetical protein
MIHNGCGGAVMAFKTFQSFKPFKTFDAGIQKSGVKISS